MKGILTNLIARFYRTEIPALTQRMVRLPVYEGKATVITGMRRTGKTYLCYQRMHQLLADGVPKDRLLYLNFEDERLIGFTVSDFQMILDIYYGMYPDNRLETCYFFFDEIQEIDEWERFIRRLIDTEKVQITLTGSSSKMLTADIATAMRGRSIATEVFPFSFEEYLRHHGIMTEIPKFLCDIDESRLRNAFERYFRQGGFPEVQTMQPYDAEAVLQQYVNLVSLRDVIDRYKISNRQVLQFVSQFVFNAVAQRTSVRNIAGHLKSMNIPSDWATINSYLGYLCDAYLFYQVPIHDASFTKRQKNPCKYYAIDVAMIRAMSSNPDGNRGFLLENMVYMHLRRNNYQIEYVMTSSGHEVDFFVKKRTSGETMLIQVCWSLGNDKTFKRETEVFAKTADCLQVSNRVIVTWDEEKTLEHDIRVIPSWKFLLGHDQE